MSRAEPVQEFKSKINDRQSQPFTKHGIKGNSECGYHSERCLFLKLENCMDF